MRSPARICGLRTCYACRQPLGRNRWHVVAAIVGVRGLYCTWLRSATYEGIVGLGMAGRGVTLVLHTSWFNCSSWIHAKEIVAIRVYGCAPLLLLGSPALGPR
ncbi:hypothetical protein B296_00020295 [Ensete ventricosum]|uniref:Uncharacterized protein n=1 Tax=Ensete ventricosum TaxID=4639 RepID=A0A426Y114_ENSVE|nr:hypothetical protein B296_00020295 [Ensete ventricosum]